MYKRESTMSKPKIANERLTMAKRDVVMNKRHATQAHTGNRQWVLIDETNGAATQDGKKLSKTILQLVATAIEMQGNLHYRPEHGGDTFSVRVGDGPSDVKPGESVFAFHPILPEAPEAVAYHDVAGKGVPYAVMAITDCSSLMNSGASASVSASHEVLEAALNPGANLMADRTPSESVAQEACDAIEMQGYAMNVKGVRVAVSNFLLRSFFVPGATGPYSYMAKHGLDGFVEPNAPMTCAAGDGGNYQIVRAITLGEDEELGKAMGRRVPTVKQHYWIEGKPRRSHRHLHFSSRAQKVSKGERVHYHVTEDQTVTMNVERYSFSLGGYITLGKAETIVSEGSPDAIVQVDRILANVPCKGMIENVEVEVDGKPILRMEDGYGGLSCITDEPLTSDVFGKVVTGPSSKVRVTAKYNGSIPVGYEEGATFTFVMSFRGPTTNDDKGEEPKTWESDSSKPDRS